MEKLTMDIVAKYNGKGMIFAGNASAIITDSGPDWGPDEWRVVKYYGKFSEERIRSCFNQLLQQLRAECNKTDCSLWTNDKHIERVVLVECDWKDMQDCFNKVALQLCWISESMLELNISIDARSIMYTRPGEWHGLTEHWLGRLNKKEMLEWIYGEVILDECTEMICDEIREQHIE